MNIMTDPDKKNLDELLGRNSGEPICDTFMTPKEKAYYKSKENPIVDSTSKIAGYIEFNLETYDINILPNK
jgi:hypothetical protein